MHKKEEEENKPKLLKWLEDEKSEIIHALENEQNKEEEKEILKFTQLSKFTILKITQLSKKISFLKSYRFTR